MPHAIVEYSANIGTEANIPGLLDKIIGKYRTEPAVFPLAGLRVRALPVHDYRIADGQHDHGFVNVTCKIGAGRDRAFLRDFFGGMYEVVADHLRDLSQRRGIGLTFYVEIADADLSWKSNSIASHLNRKA